MEISGGAKAAPYVALAGTVAVRRQDAAEFNSLLEQALAVPTAADKFRLANLIDQQHAAWLLRHREDFILADPANSDA